MKGGCLYVSRTKWKNSPSNPWEIGHFSSFSSISDIKSDFAYENFHYEETYEMLTWENLEYFLTKSMFS